MSWSMIWLLPFISTVAALPSGHGKELGKHNDLGSPALEENFTTMTSHYFYEKYVATRTPVIMRGLANTFSATHLWTDQYIRDNYGDMEVRLEAKTEKESFTPTGEIGLGRATFREFLDRYKTDNMYCVSEIPAPMYRDLTLPAIMNCGTMKDSLVEMNIWINSGGAKSIIHKDAHNQLNCLLAGSKDWIFINNKYNDGIYQAEEIDGDQGGFSLVNPQQINYQSFPLFAEVPWEYATVHAGDCLYLPPRYYHRVKSANRNFAISFLFGTKSTFDMAGCDGPTLPLPLADAKVQWKYPGHGLMSMGNSDPTDVRETMIDEFLSIVEEDASARVPLEEYINHILKEVEEDVPYIREQFHTQLVEERILGDVEFVDVAFLESLSDDIWQRLTAAYSFDPSNDPDAELYYIYKHQVVDALKEATYYGAITKEIFLHTYQDLSGSLRMGRQLFGILSDDGSSVTWYDVVKHDSMFDVFGKEHDRGDHDMFERNEEIQRRAERELRESLKLSEKAEL